MWGQPALTEQEIAVPAIREGTTSIAKYTRRFSMKASLGCLAQLSKVLSSGRARSKMIKATFILAGALAALPAMAQTITFTVSADGSGTVGSTPFTDQLITLTQVTDTTAIINPCTHGGVFLYPCAPDVATNTVTIGGLGTYTLTGPTYFFDNAINVAGIANAPYVVFLGAEDSSLASYNMQTSFGPTSYGIYSSVSSESTSGGNLSVTWLSADATFQAVLTPEPGTLTLFGSGLLALAYVLRRKRFAQS